MAGPANRKRARTVRPKFNVFSLLDHLTGRYVRGRYGLWYMNGGFSHMMGFAGRGNTFKSAFSSTCIATASLRYEAEYTEFYDSEISLEPGRLQDFINSVAKNNYWKVIPQLDDLYVSETTPWNHTASDTQSGDEWWRDNNRNEIKGRSSLKDKDMRETPFKEIGGSFTRIPSPWFYNVDSLSEMHVAAVEKMYDKSDVGESDLNTEALKDAGSKAQMMKQMPVVGAKASIYYGLIAHADDEMKLDQYAPSQKKLGDLKGNLKLKGVPGRAFSFLTNNCFIAIAVGDAINRGDKMPEYPHPDAIARQGDTDLRFVKFQQLRGKSGPTGAVLDLVFSQKEGLLVGVTEFHNLKEVYTGYGMEIKGNNQGFRLELYPDTFFTRKTVRKILNEDQKFGRAMSITAAMAYINHNWYDIEPEMRISPAELREKLIERGFDWDKILEDSVEYWYFNDQEESVGKLTLTAWTLLEMAVNGFDCPQLDRYRADKKKAA